MKPGALTQNGPNYFGVSMMDFDEREIDILEVEQEPSPMTPDKKEKSIKFELTNFGETQNFTKNHNT